jgi:hypothetical protein
MTFLTWLLFYFYCIVNQLQVQISLHVTTKTDVDRESYRIREACQEYKKALKAHTGRWKTMSGRLHEKP